MVLVRSPMRAPLGRIVSTFAMSCCLLGKLAGRVSSGGLLDLLSLARPDEMKARHETQFPLVLRHFGSTLHEAVVKVALQHLVCLMNVGPAALALHRHHQALIGMNLHLRSTAGIRTSTAQGYGYQRTCAEYSRFDGPASPNNSRAAKIACSVLSAHIASSAITVAPSVGGSPRIGVTATLTINFFIFDTLMAVPPS